MARGSPSLVALLGLLAMAGYQNRDKLGEMLNNGTSGGAGNPGQPGLADRFRSEGGNLLGGLSELFQRFTAPHQQAKAQTWVQRGPNAPLAPDELEQVLDEDTIAELVGKTGLTRDELLSRLSTSVPEAVDQATPDGTFPPISAPEPPRSV